MSAGVIKLTNKSKAVVGTGTTFLTDLNPNDFIVSKVGGVTYTLSVVAVTSDTEITLGNAYDGPNVVAAAWNALPQETAIAIPAQVGVDAAFAMRAIVAEKTNWYKLLTLDEDVTIDLPNNTQFTGPSWRKIIKLTADADLGAFTQLAEQVVSNTAQVAANTLTVTNSMTEVEKDRSEVAANKTIILDSASQVAANKAIAETKAAEAALSAAEAAQYDSTKAVTLHGEIPAADNINSYLPNITYRGVWYKSTAGATTANGYPVNDFIGIIEILEANGQGIQRASHKNGSIYVRGYSSPSYSTWIPVALGGVNSTITNLTALSGALRLGGDATNDYDAVTLKQLLAAVGGAGGPNLTGVMTNFLGAVEWFNGSRASLPSGHLAADGQLLNRADYPDLWNAISTGMLVSVSDTAWLADADGRAKYSTGNGSTTFRMPDLNGVITTGVPSVRALFLRGDQGIGGGVGSTGKDGAPNIEGTIGNAWGTTIGIFEGGSGAFDITTPVVTQVANLDSIKVGSGARNTTVRFSANRSYSGYGRSIAEIRPNFAAGIWIIRVNGKFSASSTNFNVITSDDALPGNGTVVYGGDVRSVYNAAGTEQTSVSFRAKTTIGGEKTAEIRILDKTVVSKTWLLPATSGRIALDTDTRLDTINNKSGGVLNGFLAAFGDLVAQVQPSANPPINSFLNAAIIKSRLNGRGATVDPAGAYFGMYFQEHVGNTHQGIINLNAFGKDISWNCRGDGQTLSPLGQLAVSGSDVRLKDKFVPTSPGAGERIDKLAPLEFTWLGSNRRSRGWAAQQAALIDPLYVFMGGEGTDINGEKFEILNVDQNAIIADLITVAQELRNEVKQLKEEIDSLKAANK